MQHLLAYNYFETGTPATNSYSSTKYLILWWRKWSHKEPWRNC